MAKKRRRLFGDMKEIGCGLATVLLFSAPLWVLTIGWRGPGYALGILTLLVLAVVALAFGSRIVNRILGRN